MKRKMENMLKKLFNQYEKKFIKELDYHQIKDLENLVDEIKRKIASLEAEEYRTGISYFNTIAKLDDKLTDAKSTLSKQKSSEEIMEKVCNHTYDEVASKLMDAEEMKKVLPEENPETVTQVSTFLSNYLPRYIEEVRKERSYDPYDEVDQKELYDNRKEELDELYGWIFNIASQYGEKGLTRLQKMENNFQKVRLSTRFNDHIEDVILEKTFVEYGIQYYGEEFTLQAINPEGSSLTPSQMVAYMVQNQYVYDRQPLAEREQQIQEKREQARNKIMMKK